ncbi:hypothetical protein EBU24_06965, partial [bacterium]|nr:hypothetical protein [bacterium]
EVVGVDARGDALGRGHLIPVQPRGLIVEILVPERRETVERITGRTAGERLEAQPVRELVQQHPEWCVARHHDLVRSEVCAADTCATVSDSQPLEL